jgi:hypothetical protein
MLIKLESFYKIINKYQEITSQKKNYMLQFFLKLFVLTLNILLFGHLLAILWLRIAINA